MKAGWRGRAAADRHGVPVEMRFIDLFMAALGALIFMAMLLVVLVPLTPPPPPPCDNPPCETLPEVLRFAIATRSLAAARVGEPYEVAFAYREGTGRVVWRIAAGEEEIPDGLHFDAETGVLAGTPTARAQGRFVLQARDARAGEDQRPFELVVEAAGKGSRHWETWVAGILIGLVFLLWLATLAAIAQTKHRLAALRRAHQLGQGSVVFRGLHEDHVVRLPQGIGEYEGQLLGGRWFGRFLLLVFLLLAAWLVWRVWIA